jgi:O-antigen/teichoic acid export membrane protein
MIDAAQGQGSVRSLVLRGVGWKFASQIVLQCSRIVMAVVLARLLSPHDYGLAAMVLVISSLVLVFSDLALGTALVQRRTLTERDRSTVFWTGAAAGLVFTLGGIALSPLVAGFYGEPKVEVLFAAFSLSFLVTSLGTTQKALLTREMNFRSLELRLIAGSVAGGVVGIAAAAQGYGAWAIIAQQLTVAVCSTALLWLVTPWRPRLVFSLASLRDLGGLSANVFGTRVLFVLQENGGSILIGRFLGAAALGAFTVASTVILTPLSRIAVPIGEVIFPALSRMQDDLERMASAWFRTTRLIGAVAIPSTLGLIVVAPDFVTVVLGERWNAAVPIIRILAGVGLLQALNTLNSAILVAADRTGTLLRYSLFFFAAQLGAIALGLHWGIVGVATCYALASLAVEPLYVWLSARAVGTTMRGFAGSIAGVSLASGAMALSVLVARAALVDAGASPGLRLGLLIALGVLVYVLCCAWWARDLVGEVRDLVRARRPARPPLVQPSP